MFGNALEACQKTENNGEKGHEDGEQNWWENTTNDALDRGRKSTNPVKPTGGCAQPWDVGQTTDEYNRNCPEDDLTKWR